MKQGQIILIGSVDREDDNDGDGRMNMGDFGDEFMKDGTYDNDGAMRREK